MKQILLRGGLPLLAMASLTACIDEDYDLSDIDTTSEFKVKDLVLPINLAPVTLGDIIEIKEGEQIKEITLGGETFYAVQESGTFKSGEIHIPGFHTNAISLDDTEVHFAMPSLPSRGSSMHKAPTDQIIIPFPEAIHNSFSFNTNNIDEAIVAVTDLYLNNFNIKLDFSLVPSASEIAEVELTNINIDLPKGLQVDELSPSGDNNNYDPQTGRLHIQTLVLKNGKAVLELAASKINLQANDVKIENHRLNLATNVNISDEAKLVVTPISNDLSSLADGLKLTIKYDISPLDVAAVSGTINYKLDGLSIDPVSLSSLPDFLAGNGTNLVLTNPQIYLRVNNPVADYKLGYSTGLNITAVRGLDEKQYPFNGTINVGYNKEEVGPYEFCLSADPEGTKNKLPDYSNAIDLNYSDLSYVLSGDGLPESLKINLVDPQIYQQDVEKFKLNNDELPILQGSWEFLAPLAMPAEPESDAKIVYKDVVDGWGSEDLDKLVIQKLEINLNITNDTPLEATLAGYPIDKNGNKINGVNIEGATIPGGAKDASVTIYITGEVKNLDGIEFTATVKPENSNALSPNQSITLSNIRAKVSGNYTTDF